MFRWPAQRNFFTRKSCKYTMTINKIYVQASILTLNSFLEIEWSRTAFAIPAISPRRNGKTLHFHNSITDIAANSNICYWRNSLLLQTSDLGRIENMQDCPKHKVLKFLLFSQQSKLRVSTNINMATGEMSQAITPFHFFGYFHFFDFLAALAALYLPWRFSHSFIHSLFWILT